MTGTFYANGYRKFKVCVALLGYFKGAYTNYSYLNYYSIRDSGASKHNEAYNAYTKELRAKSNKLIII